MKSIIRNLIIAAPLATAALTMVPTSATAVDGPVIIAQPKADPNTIDDIAIPEPKPPVEPKDKIALPEPKPPVDDKVGPKPKPTQPDGPGEITNPDPCNAPSCGGNDDKDGPNNGGGGGDDSSDDTTPADKVEKVNKIQADDTVELPNRIDAGLAAEQSDGGLDLAWLLAGGALVTASGAALALRTRKRQTT